MKKVKTNKLGRRILSIVLTAALVVGLMTNNVLTVRAATTAHDIPERVDEYYQIANAGNLMWFAQKVNEGQTTINAKLTADIDMKDIDWTIMNSFAGTFDGDGHTILYLCADESGGDDDIANGNRCGLFQTLSEGGTVTNLTISEAQLWSAQSAGAIVAVNNGTISKCIVKDTTIELGASQGLSAIAGINTGTVTDCGVVNCFLQRRWSATHSSNYAIGVIVEDNSGTVSNCFSYGCTLKNSPNLYAIVESGNAPVNCYYYTDATVSDTVATSKTAEAFASGEVAYLLNGSSSENVTWYQKLLTDTYPVLDSKHGIVYYGYVDCQSQDKIYANTELSKDKPEHSWKCEPDEANTNKMTFSCTTDDCTKGGTITVTAPEGAIYDGNNHTATVTVETEENEELIETPVITYTSLTEGVELVDGKPVNAGTYKASITLGEVTAYDEFEIAKATPYIKTAVAAEAVTYGATLKDSALSGGVVQYSETDKTAVAGSWSWKEVTTKPVVADSKVTEYDVVFTPTDAENYNKVEIKITLTVNKAETTPNMPESTMSALYSQKTVGALELPEGWVWNEADSAKELTVDVAVEATAIYNGADKGNYVTESVTISITRQACDHEESDILYTGEGEKAPTCTVDGIGHTECTKCKEPMQTNVTVEASGHTGGTATCKNKAECSVCHEGYGELDKNNHAGETEVKDAKKATCAVDGYTGDTYCKDCGAKIATGTKIDKSTAHTWDNGVVTKEATATEKGEKTYTCSVCKTTKKEEIPALGAPKVGEEIASEDGSATYKVTEAGENGNSVTYEAPTDKNKATVVVPATVTINNITYNVTTISDTAFAGNKKLTSVTIGDNVTGFSDKTFKGCSNLKTVDVGNGVTSIPANAFKNFKNLTTVKMGTGVKTIGKNAFYGCKKLKNLTIGKNVVTIGDKAFYKCTSLTKVTIPSKVKTIGKSTFEGCKALKTITVGKSVTKIGSKAFYGCSKTKTLTIKSSKLTTKKIGSKAFTKTPKSMTVKVPKKKFKAYKSMFIKRGVNKKAKFRKS